MKPINDTENKMYGKIIETVKLMHLWKDENSLQKGLDVLPLEDLNVKATLKLSNVREEDNIGFEDCMVMELLHWFKNSFFTWMDAPKCEICEKPSQSDKIVPPDEEELKWHAKVVEQFVCPSCHKISRFPRYNHSVKLLQTRRGRCGEWVNCFTFLCLSLGYEARLVVDWTDHAWTEYYSRSRSRWLHCDPCEGAYDQPLLYEKGWGKKLDFVIAFSPTEVQDVTWRYTTQFQEVLARRRGCREGFLLHCITFFQQRLEEPLPPADRWELCRRRVLELAELLTPPDPGSSALGGRTSGDLAWRLARGEVRADDHAPYILQLSPAEAEGRSFSLGYSCAKDSYRTTEGSLVKGWSSLVFCRDNVFRKVESDWGVAYLARLEGAESGAVSWKFDFSQSRLAVAALEMRLSSRTFESGSVKWTLQLGSGPAKQLHPNSHGRVAFGREELAGHAHFVLSAEMSGSSSWQHAQVFRQPLDSEEWPFQVDVRFEDPPQ